MARPSLYKPEYCQTIAELMKSGAKDAQLASALRICPATFYNWLKEYPEFKEAYDLGLADCEKWWEDEGLRQMANSENKKFNHWIAFMNRKFGWSGKGNQGGDTQININTVNVLQTKNKEELLEFIQGKLKELEIQPEAKEIEYLPKSPE